MASNPGIEVEKRDGGLIVVTASTGDPVYVMGDDSMSDADLVRRGLFLALGDEAADIEVHSPGAVVIDVPVLTAVKSKAPAPAVGSEG